MICTKANETLYDHLKDTIDNVQVIEEGQVCAMGEYDSETSKLIIFDDLVMEPKRTQAQISQYFIRGGKQGWSMIYISQSYFGIPKTIRINSKYVILGWNLTQRDLGIICRDFPTDIPIKTFINLYKRATSKKDEHDDDGCHQSEDRQECYQVCMRPIISLFAATFLGRINRRMHTLLSMIPSGIIF